MEFSVKAQSLDKIVTEALVIAIPANQSMTADIKLLDNSSTNIISQILKKGDLGKNFGNTVVLHQVPGIKAQRLLLINSGTKNSLSDSEYKQLVRNSLKNLETLNVKNIALTLNQLNVDNRDANWAVEQATLIALETQYRVKRISKEKVIPSSLQSISFITKGKTPSTALIKSVNQAQAVAHGIALSKDLANLPPNICTPNYLTKEAQKLGKEWKLKVDVLEKSDMEKLGMGSLLAVAQGSHQAPKLITMKYNGATQKNDKPIVLVGKGITFDTGGISLKPAPEMDEMKFDMCGAASVFGVMRAVAEMKLPINLIGIVPTCENMPDGNATRPGDIVTSMSGQTIEILNTDAEGRLILCDALTYAQRFEPKTIIDIATLTGACVIALGNEAAALFANNDHLSLALKQAGDITGDRVWPMPLWEEYHEGLKSNFADMANVAGRAGGSITAACFLAKFTREVTWAHLDIAGVAYRGGKEKGATGRPVSMLCQFLTQQ
ncbi:MAG: leucyl aminopeptidase [Ferrovum sp. 37-45-19]|nr:MAG: leucyl aminopeptidase [Ferrovum sp. 37-45-19]OZB33677.1 MAG: leucyl aminopeptidase [Ferrovum sp. 34-44-207]HQT80813.1 leucyl aminopeptidase [Ferrovaceae bacterium]